LASRDASISGLQASKADASALTAYDLQSAVNTSSVDSKITAALLDAVTTAALDAALAGKADASALAALLSTVDGKTALQSALDAILAELAALQLSGSGVVNAPAWAGFTTWDLVRGSNVVRNLRLAAPLSAALANGDDTLSTTADCSPD
ncbi:unnamed protein product, partial [Effrenium voratum]